MNKAHLTISTWEGIVPTATHFYGRLRIGDQEEDVTRALTKDEARKLNRENRRLGDDTYTWEAGGISGRFWDLETLTARAIEQLQESYPEVTVLFRGPHAVLDPQEVLLGPEPLKTQANALVAEAEANNWWEGDEPTMEDICKRWEALFPR